MLNAFAFPFWHACIVTCVCNVYILCLCVCSVYLSMFVYFVCVLSDVYVLCVVCILLCVLSACMLSACLGFSSSKL